MKITLDTKIKSSLSLVYIHPYGLDSEIWKFQKEYTPFQEFRQLFIDLPYHGINILKPDEPLNFKILCNDLIKFLKENQVADYILVGNSFGGNIAMHTLTYQDIHCKGLFICGTPPLKSSLNFEEMYFQNDSVNTLMNPEAKEYDKETALVKILNYGDWQNDFNWAIQSYKQTGLQLLNHIVNSFMSGDFHDEYKLVSDAKIPVAMLLGKDEDYVKRSYFDSLKDKLWNQELILLDNCQHYPQRQAIQQFNSALLKFIQSVS